jgi:excisionase family DNA binding protein
MKQHETSNEESLVQVVGNKKIVSITEAAKINNVTRQAIYVAIKLKKLKATKDTSRWMIHLDDLMEYRKQKYSRSKSTFQGELLFDNNKGYFSVNQAAKMLNVPAQKLYYATRAGYLKASRKGAAWVIHTDDIKGYHDSYLSKKTGKKQQQVQVG